MTRDPSERMRTARPAATHWTISTTYRRLQILGFDEREAGNLTAYVSGIAIGRVPWTLRELTYLFFLREMNRVGRGWSNADDRAAPDAGDGSRSPRCTARSTDGSDGEITRQSRFRAASGMAPIPERPASSPSDQGREGR
jgi:hypothetical protein